MHTHTLTHGDNVPTKIKNMFIASTRQELVAWIESFPLMLYESPDRAKLIPVWWDVNTRHGGRTGKRYTVRGIAHICGYVPMLHEIIVLLPANWRSVPEWLQSWLRTYCYRWRSITLIEARERGIDAAALLVMARRQSLRGVV